MAMPETGRLLDNLVTACWQCKQRKGRPDAGADARSAWDGLTGATNAL